MLDVQDLLIIGYIDRRDLATARRLADGMLVEARRRGDQTYVDIVAWRLGLIDALEGRTDAGLQEMSIVADKSERAGSEGIGVTAYRDTAVLAITRWTTRRRTGRWTSVCATPTRSSSRTART